jgi:7-cyano-7-deazaguanine synthase
MSKVIIAMSGGMDSTVMYAMARQSEKFAAVDVVFFNYGQRHFKGEIQHATNFLSTTMYGQPDAGGHFDLPVLEDCPSALVNNRLEVPEGDSDVVIMPGRNMIFIGYLLHWALSRNCNQIGIGVNKDDEAGFPDCRPDFIQTMNDAVVFASEGKV